MTLLVPAVMFHGLHFAGVITFVLLGVPGSTSINIAWHAFLFHFCSARCLSIIFRPDILMSVTTIMSVRSIFQYHFHVLFWIMSDRLIRSIVSSLQLSVYFHSEYFVENAPDVEPGLNYFTG